MLTEAQQIQKAPVGGTISLSLLAVLLSDTHTHTDRQGTVPIARVLMQSSRADTTTHARQTHRPRATPTHTPTHTGCSTYRRSIDAQLPSQHQEGHTHTHTQTDVSTYRESIDTHIPRAHHAGHTHTHTH